MEENTKVDKKVIEKKDEALVVDQDNRVINIDAILNEKKGSSDVVDAINALFNCGSELVNRKIVSDMFYEEAGALVNEEMAIQILGEILKKIVDKINIDDPYVSVNPKTGKINPEETQKKLARNADYIVDSKNVDEEIVRNILEKKETEQLKDSIFKTPEYIERKRTEIEKDLIRIETSEIEIEERNNAEVTEEKVGSDLYGNFNDSLELLNSYNKDELKLIDYDKRLKEAKGTTRYEILIEERNKFLRNNPKLEHLLDPDTGMVREGHYKTNEALLIVGVTLELSKIREIGIENLDENRKKRAIYNIIAGLQIEGINKKGSEINKKVSELLKELIPGYSYSGNPIENRMAIEKALGIENPLFEEGFEALLKLSAEKIIREVDIEKVQQNNGRISREDTEEWFEMNSEELNADAITKSVLSPEMRYFKGSALEFSKEDENSVKEAYNTSTARSWIDTKETAVKYRYAYLLKYKQELESKEKISSIGFARLLSVNEEIEKFEEKFGKLELDDQEGRFSHQLNYYAESKVLSKLSKEFIKDEDKIATREDYNKLSPEEKKIYLRNTIVALNYEKERKTSKNKLVSSQKIMNKFAKRRLEILNTDSNQFITINGDDIQINEEAIFNEYQKISRHKFENYQELSDYCELNKMEYVNDKLKCCVELDDSCFEKVSGIGKTYEERAEEIEKLKAKNYNRENFFGNLQDKLKGKIDEGNLRELELSEEIINRINDLDTQIDSKDVLVMEFQRLQNQIESSQGLDHSLAIKQRSELIRKNPDRKSDFLKCANSPNKYNNELNSYTNAIVEKNALITVAVINSLSDEKLNYLINSSDLKNKTLLTLVASLKESPKTEQSQLISAIQKICPDEKMTDKSGRLINDFTTLAPILGKELGIENCTKSELTSLIDKTKTIILQNQNAQRIDNVEEKDLVMALEVNGLSILSDKYLNLQDTNDINKTREEKFFEGSKLEYLQKDAEEFKNLYCKTLSKSWVESKEQAQSLRYMHLIKAKETALISPYFTDKQIEIFTKRVKVYEEQHPELKKEDFFENGKLKLEKKKEIEEFENMKFIGDLLSDYVMDEEKVDCAKDYKNLTLLEKRKYMVATIQGLIDEKEGNNILSKMALRRLEVISDSDKSYVIDDKENGLKLNEEALVKEFSSIYKLRKEIQTFDDLKQIYANRRTAHARSKLKFYDEISDEFIKLNSNDDEQRANEIEKHKADIALKKSLNYEKYLNPVVEAEKAKQRASKENANKFSEKENNDSDNLSKAQEERYDTRRTEIDNSKKQIYSGIKLETIDIDKKLEHEVIPNSSKQDFEFQEKVQAEQEENSYIQEEQPKMSLIGKIKNAISNFGKPNNDNTNELLPVESKKGFFDNIKDAVKKIFNKDEENKPLEDMTKSDNTMTNVFDQKYKVDVDRSEAITRFNDSKASRDTDKDVEENKEEAPLME